MCNSLMLLAMHTAHQFHHTVNEVEKHVLSDSHLAIPVPTPVSCTLAVSHPAFDQLATVCDTDLRVPINSVVPTRP